MRYSDRGFQLVEAIVVLAVVASVAFLSVPPVLQMSGDLRLLVTAQEMAGILRNARAFAVRHSANVAIRFREAPDGTVTYALYRDGDGDGVLSRDIASGTDPQMAPPRRLEQSGARARFGFPPRRRARDPSDSRRWLKMSDPIRFNASDMASFDSLGTATPGSLYLTDGHSRLAAVRVFGRTGKVMVLTYDFEEQAWR